MVKTYSKRRRSKRRAYEAFLRGYGTQIAARRSRRGKIPRSVTTHSFIRAATGDVQIVSAGGIPQHGTLAFSMNQLPDYSELATTYDRFRITKVEVSFMFDRNSMDMQAASASTSTTMPLLYVVKDYDDSTALGAVNDYLQYNPCYITRLGRGSKAADLKVIVKPKIAGSAYAGIVNWAYTVEKAQWIDFSNPNVVHYGLKYCTVCPGTGAQSYIVGNLTIIARYWFDCMDSR